MRRIYVLLILTSLFIGSMIERSNAEVNVVGSIGDEGIRDFYITVGDYYNVPEREVIVVRERGIPYEEIPVVFLIARKARVSPLTIIDLRLGGRDWIDIVSHFDLSPEIFYVPIPVEKIGPPYGKAYGYYRNKPRKEWRTIILRDVDVINLVNLKFISEHYGYPPGHVIEMRSKGKGFLLINEEIKKEKMHKEHVKEKHMKKEHMKESHTENAKGKSKGKEKSNGKGKNK
ncbi:MAG TPA: hypothetical protein VHT73_11610 [Thermodesulfobacteriota bacterium]|nr:hypothetical protein [Thermodesulfobacteriota bacterium]